jgi:hypothetical protein
MLVYQRVPKRSGGFVFCVQKMMMNFLMIFTSGIRGALHRQTHIFYPEIHRSEIGFKAIPSGYVKHNYYTIWLCQT